MQIRQPIGGLHEGADSSVTVAGACFPAQMHENQLRNVQHDEVVVLDGGHYLHWTQSQAMAAKITAFLGENLASR